VAQWLVLRRHVRQAAWWLLASMVSWKLANTLSEGWTLGTPALILEGATSGAITGLAIAHLLLRNVRAEPANHQGWRASIASLLDGFAAVWAGLVVLLVLATGVGSFLVAPDWWVGLVNPFSFNFLVIGLVLLPAAGANWLAYRLKHASDGAMDEE